MKSAGLEGGFESTNLFGTAASVLRLWPCLAASVRYVKLWS